MKNRLEYKGFHGTIERSEEDDLLFRKVEIKNDLISYEGKSLSELEISFQDSIDDYLKISKKLNRKICDSSS